MLYSSDICQRKEIRKEEGVLHSDLPRLTESRWGGSASMWSEKITRPCSYDNPRRGFFAEYWREKSLLLLVQKYNKWTPSNGLLEVSPARFPNDCEQKCFVFWAGRGWPPSTEGKLPRGSLPCGALTCRAIVGSFIVLIADELSHICVCCACVGIPYIFWAPVFAFRVRCRAHQPGSRKEEGSSRRSF